MLSPSRVKFSTVRHPLHPIFQAQISATGKDILETFHVTSTSLCVMVVMELFVFLRLMQAKHESVNSKPHFVAKEELFGQSCQFLQRTKTFATIYALFSNPFNTKHWVACCCKPLLLWVILTHASSPADFSGSICMSSDCLHQEGMFRVQFYSVTTHGYCTACCGVPCSPKHACSLQNHHLCNAIIAISHSYVHLRVYFITIVQHITSQFRNISSLTIALTATIMTKKDFGKRFFQGIFFQNTWLVQLLCSIFL